MSGSSTTPELNSVLIKRLSKFLSYTLRHHPPASVDTRGYVSVTELLAMINTKNPDTHKYRYGLTQPLTQTQLEQVVAKNDKKRFSFDEETGTLLRANQGHSFPVDLGLMAQEPPPLLFHGTATKNVGSILKNGLEKRGRQHVHLSLDAETAQKVGARHGKPYIFKVRADEMHEVGYQFYLSKNGVWLTDKVPPEYLKGT